MIQARDQYGNSIMLYSEHPRKELMEKLYAKHCDRIYVDKKSDGRSVHVGYVIQGRWFTFYNVTPWEKELK